MNKALTTLALLAALVAQGDAQDAQEDTRTGSIVLEDESGWNCQTMGNMRCN